MNLTLTSTLNLTLKKFFRLISMSNQIFTSGWLQISFLRKIFGFERKFEKSLKNFEEKISKIIVCDSSVKTFYEILAENFSSLNFPEFLSTFIILGFDRISRSFLEENQPILIQKSARKGIALKGL